MKQSKYIKMVNKNYGKLTVIKIEKIRKNNQPKFTYYAHCNCSCGNKKKILARSIYNGLTKSCGCIKTGNKPGNKHPKWSGYGEISGHKFCQIKNKAQKRNIDFDVSIKELWELFLKQDKKCKLTGEVLIFNSKTSLNTASLDRIDSSKPYVISNLQWIHKDVNIAKNTSKQKDFIQMCKKVAIYND